MAPGIIADMPLEELVEFLQEKGKNRFVEPEEIAKYLKQLARNSYRLDKEIERMMKGIPQTLTSVKGIGPVYAAGLIAEIGDIHRFDV